MKKRRGIWISLIATVVCGVIINTGCKKNDTGSEKNDTVTDHNPTNGKTTAVFSPYKTYGTVTDVDGNIYKTIVIGSQTWMAENLRTTRYRNGDSIQLVNSDSTWGATMNGAYCNYARSKSIDTIATYGRLYNWFAISDTRKIAPTGWHVASRNDWTTLYYSVGENDGAALKEKGVLHWLSPNTGAENTSGFTALPGGHRTPDGAFDIIGAWGNWWCPKLSAYKDISYEDLCISYFYDNAQGGGGYRSTNSGLSVRCIKDE